MPTSSITKETSIGKSSPKRLESTAPISALTNNLLNSNNNTNSNNNLINNNVNNLISNSNNNKILLKERKDFINTDRPAT